MVTYNIEKRDKVNGLILAAGKGSRLMPMTKEIPKALVKFKGKPFIFWTIDHMINCGIKRIGIVTGYKAEVLMDAVEKEYSEFDIVFIRNDEYSSSNNMVSLFKAKDFFTDDTLLVECDVICSQKLMRDMLNADGNCQIAVSKYNPDTMNGSIIESNDMIHANRLLTSKMQNGSKYSSYLKTINIYRFGKEFLQKKLIPTMEWYIHNFDKDSYYELAIGCLMYLNAELCNVSLYEETEWVEIDDISDLEAAERKAKSFE